jgi:hypothetical protein
VTVPAGQQQAGFEVSGANAGVEVLSAEPDDNRYAAAYARVQVRDSASALRLVVVSRDKQQVVLKVTDSNNLPYPGMEVAASGTGDPQSATSDAEGLVRFPRTPGTFQASLAAAPDVAITLTAP